MNKSSFAIAIAIIVLYGTWLMFEYTTFFIPNP